MSMTKEEAAEVILRGYAFATCPICLGLGFNETRTVPQEGVIRHKTELCTTCNMTGHKLKPRYKQACEVLGHDPPKATITMAAIYEIAKGGVQYKPAPEGASDSYKQALAIDICTLWDPAGKRR